MAYPQALKKMTEVHNSEQVVALGKDAMDTVMAAQTLLKDMTLGSGPKKDDVSNMTVFFKSLVKRMENFYYIDEKESVGRGKNKVTKIVRYFGAEALHKTFDTVSHNMERAPALVSRITLKPFKTFSWMLEKKQYDIMKDWIRTPDKRMCDGERLCRLPRKCKALTFSLTKCHLRHALVCPEHPPYKIKITFNPNSDLMGGGGCAGRWESGCCVMGGWRKS